jgi:hypothetical protein
LFLKILYCKITKIRKRKKGQRTKKLRNKDTKKIGARNKMHPE